MTHTRDMITALLLLPLQRSVILSVLFGTASKEFFPRITMILNYSHMVFV